MGARIPPNAMFELERKRAKQDETSRQQEMREAIQRRFASQGLQGSGAAIKTERALQDEGARRLDDRLQSIGAAEQADALQRQEIQAQRDFQRSERESGQAFAAEQSRLAREAQQQQFDKQFGFQTEQFREQQKQFRDNYKLALDQFDFQKGLSSEQSALAKQAADLAMEQWNFQQQTEAFNALQSLANQKLNTDQIHAFLGVLGPEILSLYPDNVAELFAKANPSAPQGSGWAMRNGVPIRTQAPRPTSPPGTGLPRR